jgi:katanin p60 ATPase-containing subunit A1
VSDISGPIYQQFQEALRRAEQAEKVGNITEWADAYHICSSLMTQYSKYTNDASIRNQRLERAKIYEDAANRLGKRQSSRQTSHRNNVSTDTDNQKEDDYEAEVLNLIQKTHIKWDDIGGLIDTKQAIKTAYGMALCKKPAGVNISSWRIMLLYGPPGTGKTLLAAATAGSLDATFFNVKVSSLLSKYFGESTKLISALYTVARRLSPSVVFLDEFESLTPPRGTGESGAERRIVSTLLAELDGLSTKEDDSFVLTMGATNLPWLLDAAMISRFQKRIFVPLPDDEARKAILDIHLTRRGLRTVVNILDLVQRTNGYSGREIEQLCLSATAHMTNRCNPDLLAIVDEGQEAVLNHTIKIEPISQLDFDYCFSQIQPAVTNETMQNYHKWMKKIDI